MQKPQSKARPKMLLSGNKRWSWAIATMAWPWWLAMAVATPFP